MALKEGGIRVDSAVHRSPAYMKDKKNKQRWLDWQKMLNLHLTQAKLSIIMKQKSPHCYRLTKTMLKLHF